MSLIPKSTTDFAPLVAKLKALGVDHVITLLGPSTAAFFHAYEQSGWSVPIDGRVDLPAAIAAVSPAFLAGALEAGAPVALSSDAHVPEHIGFAYDRALAFLDAAGVRELAVFERRTRRLEPLGR